MRKLRILPCLDSDELAAARRQELGLPRETAADLGRSAVDAACNGYYVNRKFIFMGGWIRHCGYYPSWNLRLIKRGFGEYEQLTGIGDTGSARAQVEALRDDLLRPLGMIAATRKPIATLAAEVGVTVPAEIH